MNRPVYLYVFGNLGGPFKVGYSFNPAKRAKVIAYYNPGHYFCDENAIMWLTIPLPDEQTAKIAERAAHSQMRNHVIRAPDLSGAVFPFARKTEWFNVTLGKATKIVHLAIENLHLHTS